MTKLFIVVNVDWFFLSHRLPIALEALKRGYDVTILAIEEEGKGDEIRSYGLQFIPLPSSRGGRNIFSDLKLMNYLRKVYKKEKPDIIHHVAIKPVIYGSIAARFTKSPKVINAISGLGSNFTPNAGGSLTTRLIIGLYKFSQSYPKIEVIVQNQDDEKLIKSMCNLPAKRVHIIKGSGVDIKVFKYVEEPNDEVVKVVLVSRMLWDKGIGEYVEAAKKLKAKFGDKVEFILVGKVDPQNKSTITEDQLNTWNEEGNVEWIGFQSDVKSLYEKSHIAVLPSYREGLPKSLVEALAIGRPVVTTDVPGCKEVIDDGISGYLVPAKDSKLLSDAVEKLITSKSKRKEFGINGRSKVEAEMSLSMVLDKTFNIYETV